MECIFVPELNENSEEIIISDERTNHLKALRLSSGDEILFTNGKGLCSFALLTSSTKKKYNFKVTSILKNQGELPYKLGLAIGVLLDKTRLEFAIEKAVELGATDFYPLVTQHSEKKKINYQRLEKKAIAAMEQCKRANLINIHPLLTIDNLESITREFETILLADEVGENPGQTISLTSTLCLIGPEGGFSNKEIEFIKSFSNALSWNLGNRRLRAETAVVTILSFASLKMIK